LAQAFRLRRGFGNPSMARNMLSQLVHVIWILSFRHATCFSEQGYFDYQESLDDVLADLRTRGSDGRHQDGGPAVTFRERGKPLNFPFDDPDGGENDCIDTPFGGSLVGSLISYDTPTDTRYNSKGATRCFRAYLPSNIPKGPAPVVVYFHEMFSSATNACRKGGYMGLVEQASEAGFALICADANVHWDIPEALNRTHAPCSEEDSADHAYVQTIFTMLKKFPDTFDTSRIFLAGHSEGATFTTWAAFCFNREIRGFASSGVGLKLHGAAVTEESCTSHVDGACLVGVDDGTEVPGLWGECEGCEYSPLKPWKARNVVGDLLSICLFSGCSDYFRHSVTMMEQNLEEVKMPYVMHHFNGGHVIPPSFAETLTECFGLSNATKSQDLFPSCPGEDPVSL